MSFPSVDPDQLRIGVFVHLNISWMKHDFVSNQFKIKNEQQLRQLQRLGLKSIEYDPEKSDVQPLEKRSPQRPESNPKPQGQLAAEAERRRRIEKIRERRLSQKRCEKAYGQSVTAVRQLMQNLWSQPAAAVESAGELVSDMIGQLMADRDATMQLVNMKSRSDSTYYHSINVTVLSLMLGRELGLEARQMQRLGIGALLHDLGHIDVPSKILRKQQRSKAEQDFYQMHPVYGVRQAERIGTLPGDVIRIIGEHHEMIDGSGYPKGLRGEQISELARIVAIVNAYDNLCNQPDPGCSVTPYEAMSTLFARQKSKFDQNKLTHFITHMGVYPPGSVVRLENGKLGSVVSINPQALLQPNVLLYEPGIPCSEAPIVDLREEGAKIKDSVSRAALPPEIMEYLSLEESLNYFFDASPPGRER